MARILLVDSHDRTIRTVESVLAAVGYEVVVCDGDKERLKLTLRANQPDLILVSADLQSGAVLDTLADRYRDCHAPVPIVAWSGYHKPAALKDLTPVELLLCGVMGAPVDPGELLRLVAMLAPPDDSGLVVRALADLVDDAGASGIRLEEPRGTKDLVKVSLPRMLCAVDYHDWTGCLRVETANLGAALFFEMGQLVLANTDGGKDLVRTAREEGRLVDVNVPDVPLRSVEDEIGLLMALRGIGMHETDWIVAKTAIRILSACIRAWDGVVKAIPGLQPPYGGYAEPMPVVPLLIHSVSATHREEHTRPVETHPDSVVVVRLPDEGTIASWALTGTEASVIDQLHKARGREIAFGQLIRVVGKGDPEQERLVEAVLSLLERIGYVSFSGPPWDEPTLARLKELVTELHRLAGADHFGVLGVDRDADEKQIREALRTRSLQFHPDRMYDAHSRVQETAAAIYAKVQGAYEVLRDEGKRDAYRSELEAGVDSTDMELSKVAIARGKIRLRHKRYEDAMSDFREATLQDPGNAEAMVMLAWTRFLVSPEQVKRAMGELSKIVRKDEKIPDAWYYLGRLAILSKEYPRARRYFEKTLSLDAEHVQATRELRLMDRRGQGAAEAKKKRSVLDDTELDALMKYQERGDVDSSEMSAEADPSDEEPKKKGLFARLLGRG